MPSVWPYEAREIQERLRFGSDVRKAYSGEMRDSLHGAVQILSYRHALLDGERAEAEELFRSNILGEWYVPLWHDMTRFVGSIGSADTTIAVETNADYRAGGKAIIWADKGTYTLVDVSSASGGTLTLSGAVGASYTGTTASPVLVAPVVTCICPNGMTFSDAYGMSTINVTFYSVANEDLAATSYPTLGGVLVLTDSTVVAQPLSGAISNAAELVWSGFGAMSLAGLRSIVERGSTISFADQTASDRWSRRQLLHHLRGRETPFYLPTWKADMALTGAVASAATSFTVDSVSPSASDLVGRAVQFDSGSYIHRAITSGLDGVSTQTFGIAAPGADIPADAIVSLMTLVRLDTDEVTIEHKISGDGFVSRFSAAVIEVSE